MWSAGRYRMDAGPDGRQGRRMTSSDLRDEATAQRQLEQRCADWDRSEFTSDSPSHVSIWRKPTA